MSKKKFTNIEREAIWKAHSKKCFYSRENLFFDSFHIEHIIHEGILDKPDEWKELKSKLGLDDKFDINGFENLVPVKSSYNLRKGDDVLDVNNIIFLLSQTKGKIDVINAEIVKITKRLGASNIKYLISQALERSVIDSADVFEMAKNMQFDYDVYKVNAIDSYPEISDSYISSSFLNELWERDVSIPVTLINANGYKVEAASCKDYDRFTNDGYYENTGYDVKVASKLRNLSGMINYFFSAKTPKRSFVNGVGVPDLKLLSSSMFPSMSSEPAFDSGYKTYQDLLDANLIKILSVGTKSLHVESNGMGHVLFEVSRGDFSGTGNEEVLVFEFTYVTEGSHSYSSSRLIERKGQTSEFLLTFLD